MSDMKSKMPDLKELSSMAGKLIKDIKVSVNEIIDNYKKNRKMETTPAKPKPKPKPKKESDSSVAKAPKKKTTTKTESTDKK